MEEMEKLQQRIEQLEARERQLLRHIERVEIDDRLTRAVELAGVKPGLRAAVRAMLRDRGGARVVEDGDTFRGVIKHDGTAMPIEDAVAQWAVTEEASHYIAARRTSGSGAGLPSGSGPLGR